MITEKQKHAIWEAINPHLPEETSFICFFVNEKEGSAELISSVDPPKIEEFVKNVLASYVMSDRREFVQTVFDEVEKEK